MQKSLIKQRFRKSLKSYNDCAVIQKKMADNLADMLDKPSYSNVLELGCGTGFLTKAISDRISFQTYDAVDIVDECEKYINKINPRVNFVCEDIENFDVQKKYDLIVSNASMQWVEDLPKFVYKVKNFLNGDFVFTLFGQENYIQMTPFIKSPLVYYSPNDLRSIFSDFTIRTLNEQKEILRFDSPIDVLKHIKNTGVNALSETYWRKSDLKYFEDNYSVDSEGYYPLTYNPIYVALENKK